MDSLIEAGYFVNLYYDTKLYEEVLSPSQINRIIKLKIDSDKILDDVFYQFIKALSEIDKFKRTIAKHK
jgi:hypothetical protein